MFGALAGVTIKMVFGVVTGVTISVDIIIVGGGPVGGIVGLNM